MQMYGYALTAGATLQVVACLMNGNSRRCVLQIGVGLGGVALMAVGFHHLVDR